MSLVTIAPSSQGQLETAASITSGSSTTGMLTNIAAPRHQPQSYRCACRGGADDLARRQLSQPSDISRAVPVGPNGPDLRRATTATTEEQRRHGLPAKGLANQA